MARPLRTYVIMKKNNTCKRTPKTGTKENGPDQDSVVIKGIILPANWDPDGNTTAVVLSSYNEDEYMVTADKKSSELLAFLRREVEVVGQIKKIDNKEYITVKEYFLTIEGK